MTDDVEPRWKRIKRLEALSKEAGGNYVELARGLAWAVSEIIRLDERTRFQREQNSSLVKTIKNIAPDMFGQL